MYILDVASRLRDAFKQNEVDANKNKNVVNNQGNNMVDIELIKKNRNIKGQKLTSKKRK